MIERIYCNDCRGGTQHRSLRVAEYRGKNDDLGYWWHRTFEMLQCCGCEEVVLRRTSRFSEDDEDEVRYFPPDMSRYPPRWLYKLPHDFRLLLEEIYRSLDSENLRLPMMGARTLVDMLILEKIGDVGGFKEKLSGLENAGFVSSQNRKTLYAALEVGNAAAHRGYAPSQADVEAVMDIVENMLQAVYVFPDAAEKLKKSTPPRRRRKPETPQPAPAGPVGPMGATGPVAPTGTSKRR
ncbi:MAG: DUF4145 domain-containing protein [Terriglobia bacterium]